MRVEIWSRRAHAAIACAVACSLAACGGSDDAPIDAPGGDATPRQVVTDTKQLLVGEIAEAVLAGGAGDAAQIVVTAPAAKLDWNIHGHAGGDTQTIEEGLNVMAVDYSFAPSAQADWFLLLRNRDTAPMTIEVEIRLFGDMQWSGWQ